MTFEERAMIDKEQDRQRTSLNRSRKEFNSKAAEIRKL